MDKPELIERLTKQRLTLSGFRANLRDQMIKAQMLDWPGKDERPFDDFDVAGGNPIFIEVYESARATNLCFMWLGKALFFMGEKAYTHSYDPSNKIIEPALDVIPVEAKEYADPIEMLKSIRNDFKQMEAEMASNVKIPVGSLQTSFAIINAFTYFEEACMWLGVALGNIRDRKIEGIAWRQMRTVNFQSGKEGIENDGLGEKTDNDLLKSTPKTPNIPTNETDTANESGTEGRTETDNSQRGSIAGSNENEVANQASGGPGNSEADSGARENGGREVLSSGPGN
jgi:hypothetical protein